MRRLTRLLLAVALIAAAGRAACYAAYVWWGIRSPMEAYHLESKMVHLAWRVQHGVRSYPEWEAYPHMVNVFGPLYFTLVGLIGSALGSTLDELFVVGRLVTVAAVVAAAGLTFAALRSRYGGPAALLGTLLGASAGPLYGFGLMVRPDTLSDLLGLAGFLALAGVRPRPPGAPPGGWRLAVAGGLMAGAILAKQTTAAYALAGAVGLALEGHPRRAAGWLAAVLGGVALFVAGVTLLYEPNFAPSLLSVGRNPWRLDGWLYSMRRMVILDPEFPVLVAAGLALWGASRRREAWPLALAVVIAGSSVVTLGKHGSDMNYFLGVRHVAAWAAAALWHAAGEASGSRRRRAGVLAAALGLFVGMGFSTMHAFVQASVMQALAAIHAGPYGQAKQAVYREIFRAAADPGHRLLTDSGFIDIRQGERTVYGDQWLFRMLTETGEIRPEAMRRWVEDEEYDQIITTKPLEDPSYATYDFGLPMPLVEAARRHYVLTRREAGLFFYRPRRVVLPPLTPAAGAPS
jgi:hypothetical protein